MFLRALGLKPRRSAGSRTKLPVLNGFVDVSVGKGRSPASVSVDEIGPKTLSTGSVAGAAAGAMAVFVYTNPVGKFRFAVKCLGVKGTQTVFELPARIETLATFAGAQKRSSVRIEATLPASWRFAPRSIGSGDFARASITDVSRTGASLIIDRELGPGTQVEVKFSVRAGAAPVVVLAEVMRSKKIERSGKASVGLRFRGLDPADDRAIMEFIHKRQAERRSRGLV